MNEETTMVEDVEAATTEEQAGANDSQETPQEQQQEKKYTDADVDKIVAKKIAKERARLSKMFNDEQQESDLEKRERNVLVRELKADAKDKLVEDGLPYTLANLMTYDDKDSFMESYKEVTTIFREAVQRGVKDALKSPAPRVGTGNRLNSQESRIQNAFAPNTR